MMMKTRRKKKEMSRTHLFLVLITGLRGAGSELPVPDLVRLGSGGPSQRVYLNDKLSELDELK